MSRFPSAIALTAVGLLSATVGAHAREGKDGLPYMEPPYWYYPARQTLGALLLLEGEAERAREVFGQSLALTPNNAWSLYGLEQAYAKAGREREARAVAQRFKRAWVGDRKRLDLARL